MHSRIGFIILGLILFSCVSQNGSQFERTERPKVLNEDISEDYVVTDLPIRLELLSEYQSEKINELNSKDTTAYLVQSRPIFFQIVETKNDADETRISGPIYGDVPVFVYALGEVNDGKLVDYGWIERWDGEVIWEMHVDSLQYAGGDKRNVKCYDEIVLSPGRYRLRYRSNNSHSYNDWFGEAPENFVNYGITVFNTVGIESIRSEFK